MSSSVTTKCFRVLFPGAIAATQNDEKDEDDGSEDEEGDDGGLGPIL